jgi:glycosyltransferase involved in cell wall biosynthesis
MKIAVIAASTVPSSTANSIQCMKVCQALAQNGAEVCLWVPDGAPTAWERLAEVYGLTTSFKIHWLPAIKLLKRYDFMLRAVLAARRWGAQAVYTWIIPVGVLSLWNGMAAMLEVHDRVTGRLAPGWLRRFLHIRGHKRLLPITHALRQRLEVDFGDIDPDIVQVAPMGSEPERYAGLPSAPDARAQLGLVERPTALYTGHLYAGRGMHLLLALAKALPQVGFVWVGGHPADVDLWRARLAQEKINNVTLTGFIENARLPLYQAAGDILLMPYERSVQVSGGGNTVDYCSPMKMFDYLSCGRAIITSDLPVLHEVLNENNAVFCPPGDVDAWVAAIAELSADPARCQRLAEQSKIDAINYSWRDRALRAVQGLLLDNASLE